MVERNIPFYHFPFQPDENPIPPEDSGRVPAMTAAWIRWGIERGLLGE